jgi:hypothetical protein
LSAKQSDEVAEKLAKVRAKEPLSPILLVVLRADVVTQIADGYHRTCAAFLSHEDALVPRRSSFSSVCGQPGLAFRPAARAAGPRRVPARRPLDAGGGVEPSLASGGATSSSAAPGSTIKARCKQGSKPQA